MKKHRELRKETEAKRKSCRQAFTRDSAAASVTPFLNMIVQPSITQLNRTSCKKFVQTRPLFSRYLHTMWLTLACWYDCGVTLHASRLSINTHVLDRAFPFHKLPYSSFYFLLKFSGCKDDLKSGQSVEFTLP